MTKETSVLTVGELQKLLIDYPANTPVYMQVQLNDELITYPVEDVNSSPDEEQCFLLCGDEVTVVED